MALITTIYDVSNAITTGTYYTYKGARIEVEFMGTCVECLDAVDALIESDDENEVVHCVVRRDTRTATPISQYNNPLFSAWNTPIHSTM